MILNRPSAVHLSVFSVWVIIVFIFFVLFTNLFTIKIIAKNFFIITLLRTIKFRIMIQEVKIICTYQLLILVTVLGQ